METCFPLQCWECSHSLANNISGNNTDVRFCYDSHFILGKLISPSSGGIVICWFNFGDGGVELYMLCHSKVLSIISDVLQVLLP